MNQINAATLQQRLQNGEATNLLDVRAYIEFHTFNIGGVNIPAHGLAANIHLLPYNKNSEIIVICSAGLRSEQARLLLTRLGYLNVSNLAGGLRALQKLNNKICNLPS